MSKIEQESALNLAFSDATIEDLCDAYGYSTKQAKQIIQKNIAIVKEFTKKLTPLFKWTGGKRREIKYFEDYFPDFVKDNARYTFVEPFVGAGAVFFYLNNVTGNNVINDFDKQVINFYEQFTLNAEEFNIKLNKVGNIKEHDTLEAEYYKQRNKDRNNGLVQLTAIEMAIRFFIVNQLAFSGMRRFNSDGEFNVPFGHYKGINTDVIDSIERRKLLKNTKLICGDFAKVMQDNDNKNTFIFLDPPYTRVFKEYSHDNNFGVEDHKRLAKIFTSLKNAKAMLIIDKSDLTIELYSDYIKHTYDLNYGVNIKNRFSQAVQHLIVCNY